MADIYAIPATCDERTGLRRRIGEFVEARGLVAPLSMTALEMLAGDFSDSAPDLRPELRGWVMVELSNAVQCDSVAAVPHERRVLLMPKCLAQTGVCTAAVDEIGLACRRCGSCKINSLEDRAAELGVMSIVAEGFTAAAGLVESGVVDAVIGVGCLSSLEKVFPKMIAGAVPGMAVALNRDGCRDTDVDEDRVNELLTMRCDGVRPLVNYGYLDATIKEWFSPSELAKTILPGHDHTSRAAFDWMAGEGKRWRPYLTVATCLALSGERTLPENVRLAALAVECFHKASLVHDDIQDGDRKRYDRESVWVRHGVEIAINVGDMLLGEGYRLLARCGNAELIRVAAEAHTALCRGQGTELEWRRRPREVDTEFVLDIFRGKTVPAFDVALDIGAICAGAGDELRRTLHDYSEALGIAYQLGDDIEDADDQAARLSPRIAQAQVAELAADYRARAFAIVDDLREPELKRLLMRVTGQILK